MEKEKIAKAPFLPKSNTEKVFSTLRISFMKLRVRNNSIRLRLTQTEVVQLRENGIVEEVIEFGLTPDKILIYSLASADVETICAQFENGKITISVPTTQALQWSESNQVGLENKQEIGDDKILKILIEKDFACAERRDGEDDKDAFPHPKQGAAC